MQVSITYFDHLSYYAFMQMTSCILFLHILLPCSGLELGNRPCEHPWRRTISVSTDTSTISLRLRQRLGAPWGPVYRGRTCHSCQGKCPSPTGVRSSGRKASCQSKWIPNQKMGHFSTFSPVMTLIVVGRKKHSSGAFLHEIRGDTIVNNEVTTSSLVYLSLAMLLLHKTTPWAHHTDVLPHNGNVHAICPPYKQQAVETYATAEIQFLFLFP